VTTSAEVSGSKAPQRVVPADFVLIIGAMKSGTTSLFEVLSQHPQIAASKTKEPGFFSNDDTWNLGWDWYHDLWDWDPRHHRIALEASPAYTTFPARPYVPERIASRTDSSFRFVYLLRNPLTQIPSNIRHTLFAGWGQSLDEGVPEWMIETVSYGMQIDHYMKHFPRSSLLLVTLDEFQKDPGEVLGRICTFLGLDTDFQFQRVTERYNSGEAYEMSSFWSRLARSSLLREILHRVFPMRARHYLRRLLPKLGKSTSLGRHVFTQVEKEGLIQELKPELDRLENEYGVDVSGLWALDTVTEPSLDHSKGS
jgi:hypothetical protein